MPEIKVTFSWSYRISFLTGRENLSRLSTLLNLEIFLNWEIFLHLERVTWAKHKRIRIWLPFYLVLTNISMKSVILCWNSHIKICSVGVVYFKWCCISLFMDLIDNIRLFLSWYKIHRQQKFKMKNSTYTSYIIE